MTNKQAELEKEIIELKQGCDKDIVGDNNCGEDFPDETGEPFSIYCNECLLKIKEKQAELKGIKEGKAQAEREINNKWGNQLADHYQKGRSDGIDLGKIQALAEVIRKLRNKWKSNITVISKREFLDELAELQEQKA